MWAGETLSPLVEEESELCIYQTWGRSFCAVLFFFTVAVSIGCCFIIVIMSSQVKQASQEAALIVSTGATLATTRKHIRTINRYFFVSVLCFVISACLLVWMFCGMRKKPLWTPPESLQALDPEKQEKYYEAIAEDETVTLLYNGQFVVSCIDLRDPDALQFANNLSLAIGSINTACIVCMIVIVALQYRWVNQSYDPNELLEWYSKHEAKQHNKHEEIRKNAPRSVAHIVVSGTRDGGKPAPLVQEEESTQ